MIGSVGFNTFSLKKKLCSGASAEGVGGIKDVCSWLRFKIAGRSPKTPEGHCYFFYHDKWMRVWKLASSVFASVTHCSQFKICIYFFTKNKIKLLFCLYLHTVLSVPHLPGSSDEFSQACPFLTYPHLPMLCLYLISKTYTAILSEHKYRAPHLMHSLKTSNRSLSRHCPPPQSGLTKKPF